MVINDFHIERIPVLPLKTDTPLLIDPNAVLAFTVPLEGLELICRGHHEIPEIRGAIQVFELFPRPLLYPTIEALHELP